MNTVNLRVDIRVLKRFVKKNLPSNSILRQVILSEQQILYSNDFISKISVWLRILETEETNKNQRRKKSTSIKNQTKDITLIMKKPTRKIITKLYTLENLFLTSDEPSTKALEVSKKGLGIKSGNLIYKKSEDGLYHEKNNKSCQEKIMIYLGEWSKLKVLIYDRLKQ
jgi:hypothetical protein